MSPLPHHFSFCLSRMALLQDSKQPIRVVVADTDPRSSQRMAEELTRTGEFEAVSAPSPELIIEFLGITPWNVLLVSAALASSQTPLPGFLQGIHKQHPDRGIVVLIDEVDKQVIVQAFRNGARGIVARSDAFAALCKSIVCVHQGEVWANAAHLGYLLDTLTEPMAIKGDTPLAQPLSRREQEIARLAAQGWSNRQISERLKLSEHTIKNYLFRTFEKLGVSTRVELTLYALKGGHPPQHQTPIEEPKQMPGEPQRRKRSG